MLEGEYDEARLAKVSEAIQNSLIEGLGIPPDDFFQRNLAAGWNNRTRIPTSAVAVPPAADRMNCATHRNIDHAGPSSAARSGKSKLLSAAVDCYPELLALRFEMPVGVVPSRGGTERTYA